MHQLFVQCFLLLLRCEGLFHINAEDDGTQVQSNREHNFTLSSKNIKFVKIYILTKATSPSSTNGFASEATDN